MTYIAQPIAFQWKMNKEIFGLEKRIIKEEKKITSNAEAKKISHR